MKPQRKTSDLLGRAYCPVFVCVKEVEHCPGSACERKVHRTSQAGLHTGLVRWVCTAHAKVGTLSRSPPPPKKQQGTWSSRCCAALGHAPAHALKCA